MRRLRVAELKLVFRARGSTGKGASEGAYAEPRESASDAKSACGSATCASTHASTHASDAASDAEASKEQGEEAQLSHWESHVKFFAFVPWATQGGEGP